MTRRKLLKNLAALPFLGGLLGVKVDDLPNIDVDDFPREAHQEFIDMAADGGFHLPHHVYGWIRYDRQRQMVEHCITSDKEGENIIGEFTIHD